MSWTAAPVTALGPTLVTTIEYVIGLPGVAVVAPSDLTIRRSARGVNVSVSVAVLSPGSRSGVVGGDVTWAVLTSVPVAVADTVPVTV